MVHYAQPNISDISTDKGYSQNPTARRPLERERERKEKKAVYLAYYTKEPIMYQGRHFARLQSTRQFLRVTGNVHQERKEGPNQTTPLKRQKLQTLQDESKRHRHSQRNVTVLNNVRSVVTPLSTTGTEKKHSSPCLGKQSLFVTGIKRIPQIDLNCADEMPRFVTLRQTPHALIAAIQGVIR
jgi:hypothetical protein